MQKIDHFEVLMINQPVLDRKSVESASFKYKILHAKNYELPDDPRHDESHIHGCYEIYFNISGSVSFWANNKLYPIKSGDMIVTRPGDFHFCVYHAPSVHEHFCLWLDLADGSAAGEYMRKFFSENYYSFWGRKERLFEIFSRLERVSETENEFLQSATLFELMTELSEGDREISPVPDTLPAEMQAIVDDINDNVGSYRYVSDIIDKYYISQATLNRWFRKYLNISPREFLEAKKLSLAKQLLFEGKTVTEACMLSGFSDCSHFISVFKRQFGETPFKYKSSQK